METTLLYDVICIYSTCELVLLQLVMPIMPQTWISFSVLPKTSVYHECGNVTVQLIATPLAPKLLKMN